jgi:putative hydrolase of the HAD superfamily
MSPAHPAAILFDPDGTLMDDDRGVETATKSFHSVYQKTLDLPIQDFARPWKDLLKIHFDRYLAGDISMQEQRERIRNLFGLSITAAVADEIFGVYEQFYREAWIAFPRRSYGAVGSEAIPAALLTNGDSSQQTQKVQAAGLANSFCGIFTSSEIGFAKPRAEAFLHACEQLQLDPGSCAYVGDDMDVDARGSAATGLIGIWLDRSSLGRAPDNRIRVIQSLAGLHASIEC